MLFPIEEWTKFIVFAIYEVDLYICNTSISNIDQPWPQPKLKAQPELEAKEAINFMESPTINLPLLGNPGG